MRRSNAALLLLVLPLVFAQDPPRLEFEVASIKPGKPDAGIPPLELRPGGGFRGNITLGFLLQIAYRVKPFQIVGAPAWLDSDFYTIEAKAAEGSTSPDPSQAKEQTIRRVLTLIEQRCALLVRREMREMSVYALVIAKGGPKLQDASGGDFKLKLARGKIHTDGGGKIAMLVSLLANNLDKVVLDKTGLTGSYAIDLQWTPDPPPSATGSTAPADAGPSLFTALQDQLGLKLEVQKSPVEHIVIEHVERPTAN